MTTNERWGYIGLLTLFLCFLGYVGAQQTQHKSAPLVIKEESAHRVPLGAPTKTPPPKETEAKESEVQNVVVHVVGAVAHPGVYTLKGDKHLIDAVKAAGGLKHADENRVNLAAKLVDGTKYTIPKAGRSSLPEVAQTSNPPDSVSYLPVAVEPPPAHSTKKGKVPAGVIDLNTATSEELQTLPGVGPATAERILGYRMEHGHFGSVEELTAVGGIGAKKLEKMRPWLKV